MVGHEIEYELNASLVQRVLDAIKILDCTVPRIDGAEIRNVITKVVIGALTDRRKPYGANAQPFEIINPLQETREISVAISIAVLERDDCNFINDGLAPPNF